MTQGEKIKQSLFGLGGQKDVSSEMFGKEEKTDTFADKVIDGKG